MMPWKEVHVLNTFKRVLNKASLVCAMLPAVIFCVSRRFRTTRAKRSAFVAPSANDSKSEPHRVGSNRIKDPVFPMS